MRKVLNFDELLSKCNLELKNFDEDSVIAVPSFSDTDFLRKKKNHTHIWEVKTGLYDDENSKWLIEELSLFIGITYEFPNVVPKIYISPSHIKKIGIIPHISIKEYEICTFDSAVITDYSRPENIIIESVLKAKKIIIDGLKKQNLNEFEDEFFAYWESENTFLKKNIYFSVFQSIPTEGIVKSIKYTTDDKINYYLIYNDSENIINDYKETLIHNRISFIEKELFFIGEVSEFTIPPFEYSYLDSLNFIEQKEDFRTYYNSKNSEKTVLFCKEIYGEKIMAGWSYNIAPSKLSGFRSNKMNNFKNTFDKNLPFHKRIIKKFIIEKLNPDRLINRTSTDNIQIPKYKFLIAGIGSIGSNLVNLLNNINFPEFTLVDKDGFGSENIGRHLLGFTSINFYKTDVVRKYLKDKFPEQKVTTIKDSIYKIANDETNILNSQDYIFLCTGNMNIEHTLCDKLLNGDIKKPVFMIWVEPFLLGGQCVYISPNDPINIKDLYEEIYKFKYSVIKHSEYESKRNIFIQKEIGCQSTFSPYSSTHLMVFLSSLFPEIFKIIQTNDAKSKIITWIGDVTLADNIGVEINHNESFKTIIREI